MNKNFNKAKEIFLNREAELKSYIGKQMPKEKAEELKAQFEKVEELAKAYDKEMNKPINVVPVTSEKLEEKGMDKKEEQKKAFEDYLRKAETKTLGSLRDPDGGVLCSEDFRTQMIEQLDDILEIRKRATVISTNSRSVAFPTFEYTGTVNNTAENASISEEDVTNAFGKQTFVPHKKALIFKCPVELMEDADFNVVGHMIDHFATRFAEEIEDDLINGSGVEESLGLLNAGLTANDLVSSATSINTLSVLQAPTQIKAQYRRNSAYIMSRTVVQQVNSLLDSQNRPLFRPALSAGQPATLNGYPLVEVERMTAPAADGDASFIFGDLKYMWIVERKNINVQRLNELYAANDQIGIKITMRIDAAPVLLNAFVRYNRN